MKEIKNNESLSDLEVTLVNYYSNYEYFYIYEKDAKVQAVCCVSSIDEKSKLKHFKPTITHLYVLPEFRQQGIAKKLLTSIITHNFADGVPMIRIDADANNLVTNHLFKKIGFKLIEQNVNYEFDMLTAVSLRKYYQLFIKPFLKGIFSRQP